MTMYKLRIEEEYLNEIRILIKKEYENAVYFSQIPDQKWKTAWIEEANKYEKILKRIGMSEEIPF